MSRKTDTARRLVPDNCCKVCCRPLPPRPPGQRGRPMTVCPPQEGQDRSSCGRIDARLQEVKSHLDVLLDDLTGAVEGASEEETADERAAREERERVVKQYLQYTKSFLWSELNALTNRGRLGGMAGRVPYAKKRSKWWRSTDANVEIVQAEERLAKKHSADVATRRAAGHKV